MDFASIFKERDPTKGNLLKCSLLMTWPLWINTGAWIAMSGLNIYWVSKIGPEALAAILAGNTAFMLLMAPIQGVATSCYGLIGWLSGSKDKEDKIELEKTAGEILTFGFLVSLAVAFFGFIFAPTLLSLVCADEKVISQAVVYLRIQATGGIISFSFWIINEIMRANKDMIRPMLAIFLIIALNAIFDWLFVLGNLGFPRLGVSGAALASALSAVIGTIFNFWIIFTGKSSIKIKFGKWNDLKIRIKTLKEIVRISGFHAMDLVARVSFDLILLGIIACWGTAALAVASVGGRLFRMTSVLGFDLAKTTAIIAANNLGAGNVKRAEKSGWINIGLNVAMMGTISLIFFIFAEKIMGFYGNGAEMIAVGASYLKITTIGYIFSATAIILGRVFAGAKNTKIPALITFANGVILIILAKYLPQFANLGVSGVWLAILIYMILNGSVFLILFKTGVWRKIANKQNIA